MVNSQSGKEVDVEDVTNINSKISELYWEKSGLKYELNNLSSRKTKLIAGISIAASTTAITAVAIAVIAALSIPISLVCTIALPVLLGVSVIALTVFIFCLKNTYKEIDKTNMEIDYKNKESQKLKSTKEELKKKFPCIENFQKSYKYIFSEATKKFGFFKKENVDQGKDLFFKTFLSSLYGTDYNFEDDKKNIEKKEQENYISYKYKIHHAKDAKNNGLCIEVKINYDRKLDTNNGTPMMNSIDVSLSGNNEIISKITKNT